MDHDPVTLGHVSLRAASLSRPRAREVHAPRRETTGAKLLALVAVERVPGVETQSAMRFTGSRKLLAGVVPGSCLGLCAACRGWNSRPHQTGPLSAAISPAGRHWPRAQLGMTACRPPETDVVFGGRPRGHSGRAAPGDPSPEE